MSARVSLRRSRCTDEGEYEDYDEAFYAERLHSNHGYGCIQFVAATAYLLGSRNAA